MPECYTCNTEKTEAHFDHVGERLAASCRRCTTKRYIRRSKEIAREFPALRGAQSTKLDLTEFDLQEIRDRSEEGESIRSIAKDTGISKSTVSRIVRGKR